jgi:hypothetical protein
VAQPPGNPCAWGLADDGGAGCRVGGSTLVGGGVLALNLHGESEDEVEEDVEVEKNPLRI